MHWYATVGMKQTLHFSCFCKFVCIHCIFIIVKSDLNIKAVWKVAFLPRLMAIMSLTLWEHNWILFMLDSLTMKSCKQKYFCHWSLMKRICALSIMCLREVVNYDSKFCESKSKNGTFLFPSSYFLFVLFLLWAILSELQRFSG